MANAIQGIERHWCKGAESACITLADLATIGLTFGAIECFIFTNSMEEYIVSVEHESFYKEWAQIEAKEGVNLDSGIYRLRWYADKGSDFQPIARLIAVDKSGLLYIGKSDSGLIGRVGKLVNLINRTTVKAKHSMGRRFAEIPVLQEKLKPESMKLHIELCANARERESELLEEYLQAFGELPPLNNSR